MEDKNTSLRHRIPAEKRKECLKLFEEGYGYKKTAQLAGKECLKLFEEGYGYKKTAQLAGLNLYTVRDYKRRYASGDNSWADRGGNMVSV